MAECRWRLTWCPWRTTCSTSLATCPPSSELKSTLRDVNRVGVCIVGRDSGNEWNPASFLFCVRTCYCLLARRAPNCPGPFLCRAAQHASCVALQRLLSRGRSASYPAPLCRHSLALLHCVALCSFATGFPNSIKCPGPFPMQAQPGALPVLCAAHGAVRAAHLAGGHLVSYLIAMTP